MVLRNFGRGRPLNAPAAFIAEYENEQSVGCIHLALVDNFPLR